MSLKEQHIKLWHERYGLPIAKLKRLSMADFEWMGALVEENKWRPDQALAFVTKVENERLNKWTKERRAAETR